MHLDADQDRRGHQDGRQVVGPSWSMNFDLKTGLTMLCAVIARNE